MEHRNIAVPESESIQEEEKEPTTSGEEHSHPLMGRLGRLGKHLAIITGFVTAISTLGGLTWNLVEDARSTREQRFANRISQLTSFANFGEVLRHYRGIGDMSSRVTETFRSRKWDCDSLLNLYGSGEAIYYSDELKEFAHVREFYEDLGILIRYQAIDFDLIYEAMIFPNDFVEVTAPLTACIGDNWFGKGKGVSGFSSNMRLLGKNYERRSKGEAPQWDYLD